MVTFLLEFVGVEFQSRVLNTKIQNLNASKYQKVTFPLEVLVLLNQSYAGSPWTVLFEYGTTPKFSEQDTTERRAYVTIEVISVVVMFLRGDICS